MLHFNLIHEINQLFKRNQIDYILHSHSGCTSCGVYLECIGEECEIQRIVDIMNDYLKDKWLRVEIMVDNHLDVISLL